LKALSIMLASVWIVAVPPRHDVEVELEDRLLGGRTG
jgi:hypothetical protein